MLTTLSFLPLLPPSFVPRPLFSSDLKPGTWSYMDGDDMDSLEGIEALGGDPDFFDSDNVDSIIKDEAKTGGGDEHKLTIPKAMSVMGGILNVDDATELYDPTAGLGPAPPPVVSEPEDFIWDGTEDENAYFD